MKEIGLLVVWRGLLEILLCLGGVLRLRTDSRPRGGRKRIAFQAYSIHLAQFFAPIVAMLQKDAPDIDLHFVVLPHPHFSYRSLWALRGFVRDTLKIPDRNVKFYWQILWQRYDLLMCTDVYARFPLRRTKRVLLKHGAGVSSRILEPHPFRRTIRDFDLVLVNGDADLAILRRFCPKEVAAEKIFAAGLPYLDRLFTDGVGRAAYLGRLGLDEDEPVVLVAPSWRGLQAIEAHLPGYFDTLIATLEKLDVQIIIKMHSCSFNKAMVEGDDWANHVRRYARRGIGVDHDVDDISALRHSDVLITDISSRAFNFFLLDKPVIVVCPDDVFTDRADCERIELMRQGAEVARSVAEVEAILEHFMHGQPATEKTRERLGRYCFKNPGRATEVVVGHLLQQIRADPAPKKADTLTAPPGG